MKYACIINFQRQKSHHLSQSDYVKTKGIVIIDANFKCKTSFSRTSLDCVLAIVWVRAYSVENHCVVF